MGNLVRSQKWKDYLLCLCDFKIFHYCSFRYTSTMVMKVYLSKLIFIQCIYVVLFSATPSQQWVTARRLSLQINKACDVTNKRRIRSNDIRDEELVLRRLSATNHDERKRRIYRDARNALAARTLIELPTIRGFIESHSRRIVVRFSGK